jgi:iron(III) transport system permease protein
LLTGRASETLPWPTLLTGGLMALLALLALLPCAYLLMEALPQLSSGGWLAHFASTVLTGQLWTTFVVVLQAQLLALAYGALPALLVSRYDFRGRGYVILACLLPLLLAPYVTAATWLKFFSHGFFESRQALGMQLGLASAPYVFIVCGIAASRVPTAFGEMAAALGAGRWRRLRRVHLPLFAVPFVASALIVCAQVVGDYAAAERIGIGTLSIGIHSLWFASQSSLVAAIISCVAIVPTVLLVLAAAWSATAIIGQNPVAPAAAAVGRQRLRPVHTALLTLWVTVCSLPGFWVPEIITARWAWLRWERTRFADIPRDLTQTTVTALAVVALVAVLCLLTAVVLRAGTRHSATERWAARLPWFFLANYFLPPLVLALAFVMMSRDGSWLAQLLSLLPGDLRDSRLLVVVAIALRLMPFAMLPMLDALRRTPPALAEAARALGAGPWRARAVAYAGHVWPALALGCALVFMEALKELDLSLTLQPFGYSSTAIKVYAFSRHQNMDRAAVWVLLTQLLMVAPLLLLTWRLHRLGRQ